MQKIARDPTSKVPCSDENRGGEQFDYVFGTVHLCYKCFFEGCNYFLLFHS